MPSLRLMISSFLLSSVAICLMATSATGAEDLTKFRKPNELETAYIGTAAQLAEPSLCDKISEKALYLGRKPMLARSRCYYYVTLNTGDLNWCREVREVPIELGLMNWLDERRCLFQVQHSKSTRLQKVTFDYPAMMQTLGYSEKSVPEKFRKSNRVDWVSYFAYLAEQSNSKASQDFYERLKHVPDFNTHERSQDKDLYFTREQEMREYSWTMGRGLKLCVQGRGSDNCTPEKYAMMRKQLSSAHQRANPERMNRRPKGSLFGNGMTDEIPENKMSALRRPTELEKTYYDLALGMKDPLPCEKISQKTVTVGWTTEPGFVFMPLRSICFSAVAATLKDPALCEKVIPLNRDDLDGADLTPDYCQKIIAGQGRSPHRRTLLSDWKTSLREIGFTEKELTKTGEDLPVSKSDWSDLAAKAMEPKHPLQIKLTSKFTQAVDFNSDDGNVSDSLFFSEEELQKHLYQLTLVRFHCSVRDEQLPTKAEEPKTPALMTPSGDFTLTNHHGEAVSDKTYRGNYMLVYFGFTRCAHACPMSLNAMAAALNDLEESVAEKIQPVFISLDPRNDTVDHLAEYVKMFHPRLQGLTGTAAEVRRAARGFGAFYYAGEVDGTYLVNHTGFIYMIDSEGRHVDFFKQSDSAKEITASLKQHIASITAH